jgi:ADP-dependent NAD(P)H-hydrate dehydratase / NAD(P)H-hydrate epimerase
VESPVVSSAQMREAEESAFARGVEVEALMEQAGAGIARCLLQFFPKPGRCITFAGKGHNGGDALVAARHLKASGWELDVRLAFPEEECAELTRKHLRTLRELPEPDAPLRFNGPTVLLDGLLGLGAKELLREPIRTAAKEINRLRREDGVVVIAVDIPTGLNGDTGETDPEDCITADFTFTIGFAKHGLVLDGSLDLVGRLVVIGLPDLLVPESTPNESIATRSALQSILPKRKFSSFKNQFGRVGIIAGSEGMIGAAVMATEGALRAGAGLVELFVPRDLYSLLASVAPTEAMVRPIRSAKDLFEKKIDVWAIGPGLGIERASDLLKFVDQTKEPMVIDADMINALAGKADLLKRSPGPRLLTPHPGEMRRLFDSGKMSRAGTARHFCEQYPVTLLLKGSRTIVSERSRPLSYNCTGNPGMATGGMGDVLTGVCAGLIGCGLAPYDAARVGAWSCGRAAEMAVSSRTQSEESLLPRDVLANLGEAFNELRDSAV